MTIEKISAITFLVAHMRNSVRFYRDVLGMEIIYGGEDGCFSSLRTTDVKDPILNLEQGPISAEHPRFTTVGDLSLQLSLKDGQTAFREVEIIALTAEYSSALENAKSVFSHH